MELIYLCKFLLVLLPTLMFFVTKAFVYWLLDNYELPPFINHKPYNCEICLKFWLSLFFTLALIYVFNDIWLSMLIYFTLNVLDTIAMLIEQHNANKN